MKSDNLQTLVGLYQRLNTEADQNRFVAVLMDRIDADEGYLSISYFLLGALWKAGHLEAALQEVRAALPQGETTAFGFSNVLMMLNGLLRYRHPDFTAQELDQIERFIQGLQEHTFLIHEKIAAVRARRLLISQLA